MLILFGFTTECLRKEGGGIALTEACAQKLGKLTAFHSRLSHLWDMLDLFVHTSPVHVEKGKGGTSLQENYQHEKRGREWLLGRME